MKIKEISKRAGRVAAPFRVANGEKFTSRISIPAKRLA
jgi:hypothetical protein